MSCSKDADGSDQNGGVTTPATTTGKDNQRNPEGDNPGENNKPPVNSDEDEQVKIDLDELIDLDQYMIVLKKIIAGALGWAFLLFALLACSSAHLSAA